MHYWRNKMKFKDYKYERPDFQKISATIDEITKECVGEKMLII